MNRPALVVRDGRHPFELLALAVGVLIGTLGLIGPAYRSNAIELAWGRGFAVVWYVLMLAFALFGMWAVFSHRFRVPPSFRRRFPHWVRAVSRRRHVACFIGMVIGPYKLSQSLQLERVAMYGFGYACLAYPPAALASAGAAGITAAASFLGLAIATGFRIRHIHLDLRKLSKTCPGSGLADPPVMGDPEASG